MKYHLVIIALALTSLNAHAGLNKWVDADGVVHYSDTVPPGITKSETVRSMAGKGQANAPATQAPKSLAEREAELRKTKEAKDEAAKKQAQQDEAAAAKKKNCEAAREYARSLQEGTRMITYDANGERSYMDDDARAKALDDANKAISANCN